MKINRQFLEAVATLSGTMIGAGVLGIPYVFAQSGFLTGLLDLALLGAAIVLVYLYLGEVILRTKGNHQLTGYAEKYLGKPGKTIMALTMILGNYGAMTAFLIGIGIALSAIFNSISPLIFSIAFFIFAFIIVYYGGLAVKESELILSTGTLILVILISLIGAGKMNMSHMLDFSLAKIFIPYGAIFFALGGALAIPELKRALSKDKDKMKSAIILGASIPVLAYALFAFVVVGVTNLGTTQVATVGLGQKLGMAAIVLGNLFAVLAMATTHLMHALALKHMFYDYNIPRTPAWLLATIPPLLIFLFTNKAFVAALAFTGALAYGVEGIIYISMFWIAKKKGNRKPEYSLPTLKPLGILMMLVFILGMAYEILKAIGVIVI